MHRYPTIGKREFAEQLSHKPSRYKVRGGFWEVTGKVQKFKASPSTVVVKRTSHMATGGFRALFSGAS